MKRSTVLSLQRWRMIDLFGKNRSLLLLCALFVIGVISGVLYFNKSDAAGRMAEAILQSHISARADRSFWSVMLSSFASELPMLVIAFVGGASMMGVVLVPVVVCYRGLWYGVLSALLYSAYSLKGIAFNAIIVIPPALPFVICLLLSARESIGFSTVIARLTLPRSSPSCLYIDFKNYCGRYLLLALLLPASALIDAILSCSFFGFFEF